MKDMKVFYSLDELSHEKPRESAVTLGVFDGVHLGHKKIIDTLVNARKSGQAKKAYLITFDPHPVTVTHSRIAPPILTTLEERILLLRQFPLDGVFVVTFNDAIASMDYRLFLEKYLLHAFNMKHFVLGYDCHFGKNREGSPEKIAEEAAKRGFKLKVVPPVFLDTRVISSTQIRNSLIEGNLNLANKFLGHPYVMIGRVVRGHGMGRTIGFPTANLSIANTHKAWPPNGVYAVHVGVREKIYGGMMNVGVAPTMKSLREGKREIEVHLFDFKGDIYDDKITVSCVDYLRAEKAFAGGEELAEQLRADKKNAIRILREAEKNGLCVAE